MASLNSNYNTLGNSLVGRSYSQVCSYSIRVAFRSFAQNLGNYTGSDLAQLELDDYFFLDAMENDVYLGDFEGSAVSHFPLVVWPSGEREAWLLSEFEGTLFGEYSGTLTMIAIYYKPNRVAEWQGRWMILSGTGDFEYLRGHGVAWGPGAGNAEEGEPNINYTGMVYFLEPIS